MVQNAWKYAWKTILLSTGEYWQLIKLPKSDLDFLSYTFFLARAAFYPILFPLQPRNSVLVLYLKMKWRQILKFKNRSWEKVTLTSDQYPFSLAGTAFYPIFFPPQPKNSLLILCLQTDWGQIGKKKSYLDFWSIFFLLNKSSILPNSLSTTAYKVFTNIVFKSEMKTNTKIWKKEKKWLGLRPTSFILSKSSILLNSLPTTIYKFFINSVFKNGMTTNTKMQKEKTKWLWLRPISFLLSKSSILLNSLPTTIYKILY